ncbi:MAG: preprotein translocase subunit SecG [Alphaproteobacteria bacterium CG_4_10_14_0_8_um_filter_53_9]|nr:MAG: preprotein translocase subunit SecG [Alphaproteobacteria bacterium CG_4_10_14_0_8_um_filter_53_9]
MTAFLLTLNALVCISLVILILLQRNDPASGGMFGGAGGAGGPAIRNPLATPTAYLAAAFLILSLVIAYTSKGGGTHHSVVGEVDAATTEPKSETHLLDIAPAEELLPEAPQTPSPTEGK